MISRALFFRVKTSDISATETPPVATVQPEKLPENILPRQPQRYIKQWYLPFFVTA
jgi:hypothetical protein